MTAAYTLNRISYRYNGAAPVLELPHLSIPSGGTIALVGPNGAGKTTLLQLLALLMPASQGEIRFFGELVDPQRTRNLRGQIGLVMQNPYLLRGSVLENVEIGLRYRHIGKMARRAKASAVMDRLGLTRLAAHPARALSGGEQQRVAIARTLVLDPKVLLLDEPFTYLDQNVVADMERLISQFAGEGDHTIIFSTHDQMRAQSLSDQILSLVSGRLITTPMVNVLRGKVRNGSFETGRISIRIPEGTNSGDHLAIEPTQIVLSNSPLASSMRNSFQGRVQSLSEENGKVRVMVNAGEPFQVIITRQALEQQALTLGKSVWLSFKSTAVKLF